MIQTVVHPSAGNVRHLASAIRFDDAPPAASTPPPRLGEHTREVLVDWLEADQVFMERLESGGAFGNPDVRGSS